MARGFEREGETVPDDTPGLLPVRESSFVGRQLGEFLVDGVIARGGMGMVFRGRRAVSNAPVAIKVLLAGARAKETTRQRFEREAEVVAALRHPHIVQVLSVGVDRGHPWIALELVEGGTLEQLLPQLAVVDLVDLMIPVARAVGFAHQHGVIHRDLKPSNILIREGDQAPVVTDFGLARDLTQASDLTRSGVTLGTPVYMAPEQAFGRRASPETDVYGLGAILYEGLAGQPPFDDGDGVFALFSAIEKERPQPPSTFRDVPPGLEAIVLRALEKRPQDRYPTANALANALEEWRSGDARPSQVWIVPALATAVLALVIALVALTRTPEPPTPATDPTSPTPLALRASPPAPPQVARRVQTLQPGPVEGVDATVRNDGLYANDNFGNDRALLVGDRASQRGDFRAFLRLASLSLPEGATIRAARLELTIGWNRLRRPIEVQAHRVVETRDAHGRGRAQTPWVEGAGGRDRFLDGICWSGDLARRRFPTGTSRMPQFTQPRVAPEPLARARIGPGQTGRVVLDLTAAVRAWADAPGDNHGLRLAHTREGPPFDDGRLGFCSSDEPDAGRRPRWVIEYDGLPPPSPPDPEALQRKARAEAAALLKSVGGETSASALGAVQRACELAPFWGEPFFHRARLLLLRYQDTAIWTDFNVAERAPEPYQTAELYLRRGRELIRLGSPMQALQDAERARRAGAVQAAAELRRAAELAGRRRR